MESNQLNNTSSEEALFELLTLTCEINRYGHKTYRNKEGQVHRIHGPAIILHSGRKIWQKFGKIHREDGPAVIWENGGIDYWINDIWMSKSDFIQWQKDNGITPNK